MLSLEDQKKSRLPLHPLLVCHIGDIAVVRNLQGTHGRTVQAGLENARTFAGIKVEQSGELFHPYPCLLSKF